MPDAATIDHELHDEVGDDDSAWLRHWDPGRWLSVEVAQGAAADCLWLETLAHFDTDEGWATYGQLTCADWLMHDTGMARATAYEKLRVGHQLVARPTLAHAYRNGDMSYSAVRACARMDAPDPEVDAALVQVARAGSVADVERAVRTYQLHAEQDTPPPDPTTARRLQVRPWTDGMTKVEVLLTDLEAAELTATLQAFLNRPEDGSAAADLPPGAGEDADEDHGGPVDGSAAADGGARPVGAFDEADGAVDGSAAADEDLPPIDRAEPERSWATKRADAFVELVRAAHTRTTGSHGTPADRYLVHLVSRAGTLSFPDGTPLDPATAATVSCDAAVVTHTVGPDGEPLHLGRRTPTWSTAQRRAATIRDGATCRFPGCHRHTTDLHHHVPWEDGGPTDITNAVNLCPRHHTLIHHSGFRAHGTPNGTLRFTDPDGWPLGATTPAQDHLLDPALLGPRRGRSGREAG